MKTELDFCGVWKNQRGSTLALSVQNGAVTGTFDSGVGEAGRALTVEVQGRTFGDQLTFNAIYPQFRTIVSWVGQLTRDDDDTPLLETVWLHSSDIKDQDEAQWLWGSVRAGADQFRRRT